MIKKIVTTMFLFLMLAAAFAHAGHGNPGWVYQVENVLAQADEPNFGLYYGAATLDRKKQKISGRIMTTVENAGEAYTVWFVIFNKPQFCATSPCGFADLPDFAGGSGDPRVDVAVISASGAISASDGNGGGVVNADFEAYAGKVPAGICCFGKLAHRNGHKAEVHIIVDFHPPPIDPTDEFYWTTHLTTPFMGHRFAIFLPTN